MVKMTAAEKVLEQVDLHFEEAKLLERRGLEGEAKLVRSIVTDYKRLMLGTMPEWVSITEAQAARGYSARWWRDKCQELADAGRARKTSSGRWEVHRSALSQIQAKEDAHEEIDPSGDLRELADRLAEG